MRVVLSMVIAFIASMGIVDTAVATSDAPAHIPTWAYDEYWAEGANVSSDDVRKHVTYAEGGFGNAKAVKDCTTSPRDCFSVWYFDPHLIYGSTPICPKFGDTPFLAAASENWYVHAAGYNDAAHRVQGTYTTSCNGQSATVPVYVANIANPGVQSFFQSFLRSGDAWDFYFMDDTKGTLVNQMYGPGGGFCRGLLTHYCTSTQEFANDAALQSAQGAFANAMSHSNGTPMRFFLNGDLSILRTSDRFVGMVCENCVVSGGTLRTNSYESTLTSMATVEGVPNAEFVLLSTGAAPAGTSAQILQRTVATAVVWLGFQSGRTVAWANLEDNTKNLAVWPEQALYPTSPLESMSSSAEDIAVAPGVWRREFAQCYDNGAPIGPCAALLNANPNPVPVQSSWLHQSYGHIIRLDGGDALNGGSISLSSVRFTRNQTMIQAGSGVLLDR